MQELIVRGRYVWGGAGQPLLTDSAVLCQGDRIAAIGPAAQLAAQHPGASVVGAENTLVLPGLINAHHHGRGLDANLLGTPDDALEPWMLQRVAEPFADPYWDTMWAAAQLLARGVTTVVHFQSTRQPAAAAAEAAARLQAWRDAGIRVSFGLDLRQIRFLVYGDDEDLLQQLPPDQADQLREAARNRKVLDTDEYFALFDQLRREYESARCRLFMAPTGPQWVTEQTWRAIAERAAADEIWVQTHALETPYQKATAPQLYGQPLVPHLHELGVLGPRMALIHAVWLTEDDARLLAETGTSVIHNPGANLRLRSGIAPVPALLEAGVNVALGTDGFTLGDDDLLAEMRLARHLHRWPGIGAPAIEATDVFAMVGRNAAQVTPYGDDIGSLQPGSLADFTLVDIDAVAEPYLQPGTDPLELVIQRACGRHVQTTIVGGEVVAEHGRPVRFNVGDVAAELRRSLENQGPRPTPGPVAAAQAYYRSRWEPAGERPYWPRNGR